MSAALGFVNEAGRAAAGEVGPPPSSEELVGRWCEAVGAGGAGRMLAVLAGRYPATIDREALAEELGLAASGGTFSTYLSRLVSNGLATRLPEGVRAGESSSWPGARRREASGGVVLRRPRRPEGPDRLYRRRQPGCGAARRRSPARHRRRARRNGDRPAGPGRGNLREVGHGVTLHHRLRADAARGPRDRLDRSCPRWWCRSAVLGEARSPLRTPLRAA